METLQYQVLVKADEMKGTAALRDFQIKSGNNIEVTFYNVYWTVCHTDKNELGSDMIANRSGNKPVPFYFKEKWIQKVTTAEFFGFKFQKPFHFDGKRNLLFELSYLRKEKAGTINSRVHTKTNGICECANDTTSTTGEPGSNRPCMRIYYTDGTSITINPDRMQREKIRNFVHPFSGNIVIALNLKTDSRISCYLFDSKGVYLGNLINKKQLSEGKHFIELNNENWQNIISFRGVYIIHYVINGSIKNYKLIN